MCVCFLDNVRKRAMWVYKYFYNLPDHVFVSHKMPLILDCLIHHLLCSSSVGTIFVPFALCFLEQSAIVTILNKGRKCWWSLNTDLTHNNDHIISFSIVLGFSAFLYENLWVTLGNKPSVWTWQWYLWIASSLFFLETLHLFLNGIWANFLLLSVNCHWKKACLFSFSFLLKASDRNSPRFLIKTLFPVTKTLNRALNNPNF